MSADPELAVRRLREAFEPHADPVRATAMAAYMRNLFPFLGISSPQRRALQRTALAGAPPPGEGDLAAIAGTLWALPEREYQYAACDILERHVRVCGPAFLPVVERLVTTKSWWDTVDALASHVVGPLVIAHPELAPTMDEWAESDNTWLARSAILHQLGYKGRTDAVRLFRYCDLRCHDSEFFLRKAIGWALREYSKTDPDAVRAFVASRADTLSPLSRREALLWLSGGRKARKAGS